MCYSRGGVNPNEAFSFNGTANDGKLGKEIKIEVKSGGGMPYAGWLHELLKRRPIETAEFSDPFTWVVSNDDGTMEDQGGYSPIDPGDDGGGTEYDYGWDLSSSDDPSAPQAMGSSCARYDKDVAKTEATKIDDYNIQVTVTNAYPCYYPTVFYGIINDGNVPGKIESIVVDEDFHPNNEEDNVADDIEALDVTVGGISVGQTIDAGEEVVGNLAIHVEQVAEENWVYNIRVKIETSVAYCGPCVGKVTWLTLKYNGENKADIAVEETGKAGNVVFEGEVQSGGEFDFSGSDKNGTLGNEIEIWVDDELAAKIHTSCSKPIGPGLVVGDFEVVEGASRFGGPLCPIPPIPECGECKRGVTSLTLKYNGENEAYIAVEETGKAGNVVFGPQTVQPDGEFDFSGTRKGGTLGNEIEIYWDGEVTKIHTSCSQPIGIGSIFGPFTVIDGASREGGKFCPISIP